MYCYYIMKIIVELDQNKNLNPTLSDFKYCMDFGFWKMAKVLHSVGFGFGFGICHIHRSVRYFSDVISLWT